MHTCQSTHAWESVLFILLCVHWTQVGSPAANVFSFWVILLSCWHWAQQWLANDSHYQDEKYEVHARKSQKLLVLTTDHTWMQPCGNPWVQWRCVLLSEDQQQQMWEQNLSARMVRQLLFYLYHPSAKTWRVPENHCLQGGRGKIVREFLISQPCRSLPKDNSLLSTITVM